MRGYQLDDHLPEEIMATGSTTAKTGVTVKYRRIRQEELILDKRDKVRVVWRNFLAKIASSSSSLREGSLGTSRGRNGTIKKWLSSTSLWQIAKEVSMKR